MVARTSPSELEQPVRQHNPMSSNNRVMAAPVSLIARPHPFSTDRIQQDVPEGLPIADVFRLIGLNPDPIFARVFIDDQLIPKAEWEWAMPAAGQRITIRVIPTNGGGGQGKDAMRIVAMIGVVVASLFAPYLAPVGWGLVGAWTGAALTATVAIAGSLAVNALIPPPKQNLNTLSGLGATSPTLSLTGSSNQLAPYAPIPRPYGLNKIFPPLAARPFTEVVGNDQYLRLLFCCGYGPLLLSELKIGQTPIEQFQGVEMEIRQGYATDAPLTLIPDDVIEDNISILLTAASGRQVRRSQSNARELSVDVTWPNGLGDFSGEVPQPVTVQVEVAYRPISGGAWTVVNFTPAVAAAASAPGFSITADPGAFGNNYFLDLLVPGETGGSVGLVLETQLGVLAYINPGVTTVNDLKGYLDVSGQGKFVMAISAGSTLVSAGEMQLSGGMNAIEGLQATDDNPQLQRRSLRWLVPTVGEYEIGLTRLTGDTTNPAVRDQVLWTTLRTIQAGAPVTKPGLCLVAMRIKATDQLNGTVDQFNCLAQSVLLDWTGTSWALAPTSNPASIYRDVLQGSANARPLADSRLDLATIQAFHTRCANAGFGFNAVIDFQTTVFELCRTVLSAARGSFGLRDATYTVVEELSQTVPIQHFTPRNSWGFRGTRTFVDLPHALKVRFVNPDKDWQQDEQLVYADGYSAANASKFETLDLMGVTDSEQAWKLGRYHLAVAQLRPETYALNVDIENLVCTRGDLVRVVHDVPLFGAGYGRVKTVATDGGGNATAVTLDDLITMDATKSYAVRFRKSDGSSLVQQLVTVAGEQSTFTFTASISAATKPAVGDLALLGVLGSESVAMVVKSIEPGPDLTAKLTLVDAAPGVLTADTGSIPPFDSQIMLPASALSPVAPPIIDLIQSDESVLLRDVDGSYQSRILVTLHFASGFRLPVSRVEAQYRRTDSSGDWTQLFAPISGTGTMVSILPVQDGVSYDVRVRTVNEETGATSDWVTINGHRVIGKTTPPPDVSTLLRDGDRLVWAYPSVPLDFAGFAIRRHFGTRTSWEDAQPIQDGLITGTSWPLPGDLAVMTYLIKGMDTAANESASANWVTVDLGDLLVENLLFTEDKKAASFPGTHNGVLSAGNLAANTAATFWTGHDGAPFWSGTDSQLFWTQQYLALEYVTSLVPDADKVPCTLLLDLAVAADSYQVDYRVSGVGLFWSGTDATLFWSGTDTTLFWSGDGTDWLPWLGRLAQATRQVYEWRVRTGPGPTQAVISQYDILVDVPDIDESYQDVTIAAGTGSRIPITRSYRGIKNVEMNLVNDGGTALSATIEDYGTGGPPLTNGPLVRTRDTARAAVAGRLSGRIKGW